MSNGLNFFTWLREGVRQSVLLGVSDAVEQLGTPAGDDELHPSVTGFLSMEGGEGQRKLTGGKRQTTTRGKKRLGKSLKEIDGTPVES